MTIPQAFAFALQHHQSGRLAEAEAIYRQILAVDPRHADALHFLGLVAQQTGRPEIALDLLRQSIALAPNSASFHGNFGAALAGAGHFEEAITAYRQAIALQPDFPEVYSNLGNALRDQGKLDEAIAAYRQSIALRSNLPEAHNNLGNALRDRGQVGEAIAAYGQAILLRPTYAEAHSNRGNALADAGQSDAAISAYRQAIALQPNYAEAYNNLGKVLRDQGQMEQAIAACRQAVALQPAFAEAYSNLGQTLRDAGLLEEAVTSGRRAIALKPTLVEAHNHLGNTWHDLGHFDEAMASYRQAIALQPDNATAHSNLGHILREMGQPVEAIAACRAAITHRNTLPAAHANLGNALRDLGQPDAAIAAYRQAIALRPGYPEAHGNLGTAWRDVGQLDEAIASYRQALMLNPRLVATHSDLIFTLYHHPAFDTRAIADQLALWNQQYAEPLRQDITPHPNHPIPDRRLRIGYVSPDFREHPVGHFLLPLLTRHDRDHFEIHCYAQVPVPDARTGQLRAQADHWHSIVGLNDEQAATLIREHQIDILVDLALHTAHHRLLVFARKPAPVQLTYLAYAGSSGLSTMDYRLSDPFLDPPDAIESHDSEQTLRLPRTYWCYQPVESPPVTPLPAHTAGHITFGCLNNFPKVSGPALETWTRLLQVMPDAQLLLLAPEGSARRRIREFLEQAGVDPRRLRFVERAPLSTYLQMFAQIDIALDPFPYGGGTTTCDALWMGVPVVSLAGQTAVGRGGGSILSNIGLPELVARTKEEYVQIASNLARNIPHLDHLRMTLRDRMQASPMMDAPQFTRDVEQAYRTIWSHWCAQQGRPV